MFLSRMTAIKNQSVMQQVRVFFRYIGEPAAGAPSIRRIGRNFLVTAELRSVSSALSTSILA